MTAIEAKELSLEVWRYLAEHPEITDKEDLPGYLFGKIVWCAFYCPLCDLYHDGYEGAHCDGCPLGRCAGINSLYGLWRHGSESKRKIAARRIVERLEAWEPGEEL